MDVETKEIQSRSNETYKRWTKLLSAKHIKRSETILVSGLKIINETLKRISPVSVLLPPKFEDPEFFSQIKPPTLIYQLSTELFQSLDELGTHAPIIEIKKPKLLTWNQALDPDGKELLLPLGDPLNLGAAIRSAVGFQINKVVLLSESASPFLQKSIRASAGTTLTTPLFKGPSIHDLDIKCMALDMSGDDISKFDWPKSGRLLVGEEGLGIPKNLDTKKIKIPLNKDLDSLNATVTVGVALYEWTR